MMRRGLAIRSQILTPLPTGEVAYWKDGGLLLDDAGTIAFVGPYSGLKRRHTGPIRDLRGHLTIPGLVDCHVHFPQTRIMGHATGPLLEWLKTSVFPEEARFERPAYARTVATEMLNRLTQCGTTTAGIFSSSSARATEILFRQFATRGLRATIGLTLMDRGCPANVKVVASEALPQCDHLIRKWHGHDSGRLRFAITPRFALSCSRKLLKAAGQMANHHELPIQTHIGETKAEGEATKKVHPYAKDYLDVYDQAGLLNERSILAHAIHLSASEWRRVGQAGASIAHCPDSNFFLGSGRMPLAPPDKHGIDVGLGSDVAAGRSFSMRRAMASAYDNALCRKETVSPERLLYLATLGGAKVLGLGETIGSLESGKDGDLAVFRVPPRLKTVSDLLAWLLFDTDDPRAARVYVRGKLLEN